jgi:aminoglycoside phosphotransferase (APT) family kinase protein
MDEFKPLFAYQESSFTHGDFQPKNIMVNGSCLSGIVDFDSFCFGDPSFDLHLFLQDSLDRNVPQQNLDAFIDAYSTSVSLPDQFHEKGPFYRMYRAIQEVISLPFHLEGKTQVEISEYKNALMTHMKSIANGSFDLPAPYR